MSGLTLHYWGIKARNYAPVVIAQAGGLALTQDTSPDLAAMKPTLPFGQLPYLVDHDSSVTVAQSGAVIRYLANKASLDGRDNSADFAMSEMLIEEMQDILTIYNKCQSPASGTKSEAFEALFNSEDSNLIKQFAYLETLLKEESDYFCGSKALAGDYCITCSLDQAVALEPTVLNKFPKLAAFYGRMIVMPAFDGVKDYAMYFSRA